MTDADLLSIVRLIARAVEIGGVAAIVLGILWSGVAFLRERGLMGGKEAYQSLRANIGRSILLGLELLVAADIINSVAIEPTLKSFALLAGIILIRTFLSFALEAEIEGRWPWQARQEQERSRSSPPRNGGARTGVERVSGQEKEEPDMANQGNDNNQDRQQQQQGGDSNRQQQGGQSGSDRDQQQQGGQDRDRQQGDMGQQSRDQQQGGQGAGQQGGGQSGQQDRQQGGQSGEGRDQQQGGQSGQGGSDRDQQQGGQNSQRQQGDDGSSRD